MIPGSLSFDSPGAGRVGEDLDRCGLRRRYAHALGIVYVK